jgi:hypothetical protein
LTSKTAKMIKGNRLNCAHPNKVSFADSKTSMKFFSACQILKPKDCSIPTVLENP